MTFHGFMFSLLPIVQDEIEARSLPHCTVSPDRAAVQCNDAPADRKAKTASDVLGIVGRFVGFLLRLDQSDEQFHWMKYLSLEPGVQLLRA